MWDGVQIVPEDWVEESLSQKVDLGNNMYYGYQWWSLSYNQVPEPGVVIVRYVPFAMGFGGQHIFISPTYDVIVCITADNGLDGVDIWGILFNYIFPSIM